MDKQSSIKMAQVIRDTRNTLLSVTAERDKLAQENAAYKRREQATKVASTLHSKGLELDTEFPDLVERLEKEAAAGRLSTIAQAAEMIGPRMTIGFTNSDMVTGEGTDALTRYLVGDVG